MAVNITKNGILTCTVFSETFVNPLDPVFYIEPDNSVWIKIVHHNDPATYKFAQSNDFSSSVYIDSNRWFYASLVNKITNNTYEFMVKQKLTTSANETKYRWIQTKNPFDAVFGDVDAADVTKITTTGYSTHSSYGGIYKLNSNKTYFVANNGTQGNWYCALGCWVDYQGGIPGYAQTVVKSGYIDLYLRIDNQINNVASIFNNSVISSEFIEF